MTYVDKVKELKYLRKLYVDTYDKDPKDKRLMNVLERIRTLDVELRVIEKAFA